MTDVETIRADVPTLESFSVDAESIPSPPLTVLEVVRRADDPDVTVGELARLIELDVVLAVQVLRMANSALYSPVNEINTIERALTTLGLRSARLLAISASLRMIVPDAAGSFDTSEIRRRMVVDGSLARKFAVTTAPAKQDEAFLAGLLSGLGPVVLCSHVPDLCGGLVEEFGGWPEPEVERERFGYTTDELAAHLLRGWNLPGGLAELVEQRSTPIDENDSGLRRAVKLGYIASGVLCGPNPARTLEQLLAATSEHLNFSTEETHSWLVDSEPIVKETAELLQFQFPQTQAYSELLIEATMHMQQLAFEANTAIVEGNRQLEALTAENQQLTVEATIDSLTQLPNRGQFDRSLDDFLAECRTVGSRGQTLGLLIIDLDHFKTVNDTHGHSVGDALLRAVGNTLREHTRGDDVPARYGGDEFVVLLPRSSREELDIVAGRLCDQIGSIEIEVPSGEIYSPSVSIGGALYGETANDSRPALLERADSRLYEAKSDGRNQHNVG